MIGVSGNPSLSSFARVAATRPSIMSLGATMSAPASAWLAAVCASSLSVGSFRIFTVAATPSSQSLRRWPGDGDVAATPQWPWLMYSQRHTSVTTSSDGSSFFSNRTVCCTMPFFA